MDWEDQICPVCNVGVLEPVGDAAGHLVCTLCSAQSQDAVMESMEEREGMGELLHHRVSTGPKERAPMTELRTFNASEETLVYVKCFQSLLQDQAKVVNSWFECKGYDDVLKQVWKLVLVYCKLMDNKAVYKVINRTLMSDQTDSSDSEMDGSDHEGEERRTNYDKALRKQVQNHLNQGQRLVGHLRARLPLSMTLVCHLLTAWTLKLPLWASDLTEAALSGTLPFLGAAHAYGSKLEGFKYAIRAIRDPTLYSINLVMAKAQTFAASVKMVVPELNLGAFVHRHCACLGLPHSVATAATHVALARVYSNRRRAHTGKTYGGVRLVKSSAVPFSLQSIQKAPVFLPILLVCKHALKCAAVHEAGPGRADSLCGEERHDGHKVMGCSASSWRMDMKEWVMQWQSVLQLQHLSWPERCRVAAQGSMKDVLDFTRVQILDDPEPPAAFKTLHEHLKAVREDGHGRAEEGPASGCSTIDGDAGTASGQRQGDGMHGHREEQAPQLKASETSKNMLETDAAVVDSKLDSFPVLVEDCSAFDFSGQVFLQLMRVVAQEMGIRVSSLDKILVEFEHSCTIA